MSHRRRALLVIGAAVALDVALGLSFAAVEHLSAGIGLYWSVATATTVGYGDVVPRTGAGHVIAVAVMLTVIPLFAATFSLLTSGLTTTRVHDVVHEVHDRTEAYLQHLTRNIREVPDDVPGLERKEPAA